MWVLTVFFMCDACVYNNIAITIDFKESQLAIIYNALDSGFSPFGASPS